MPKPVKRPVPNIVKEPVSQVAPTLPLEPEHKTVTLVVPRSKKARPMGAKPVYGSRGIPRSKSEIYVQPQPVNRLYGEDDIDDTEGLIDEPLNNGFNEQMSIDLQNASDKDVRKRCAKVQTRLDMVREDARIAPRIRSKEVVDRIRKANDDYSMGE